MNMVRLVSDTTSEMDWGRLMTKSLLIKLTDGQRMLFVGAGCLGWPGEKVAPLYL